MSAAPARSMPRVTQPTAPRVVRPPKPPLRVVAAPIQSRSLAPFVLLCAVILVASLLIALVLNIQMAKGSFEESSMGSQIARVDESNQALSEKIAELSSLETLAERAKELGMIEAPAPVYIGLENGTVIDTGK